MLTATTQEKKEIQDYDVYRTKSLRNQVDNPAPASIVFKVFTFIR